MARKSMLATAALLAVALGAGYGATGEMAVVPRRPTPEEDEQRLRREMDEVHGHQERLRKAREKRARKSARRAARNTRNSR